MEENPSTVKPSDETPALFHALIAALWQILEDLVKLCLDSWFTETEIIDIIGVLVLLLYNKLPKLEKMGKIWCLQGCGEETFLYSVAESKLVHNFLKAIWQYRFIFLIKSSKGKYLLT